MQNRTANIIAALMLTAMLVLAFFSMLGDSMTMDEVAHLPAGYSYITQRDMRLNPEHPPLMKDMAGIGVWLWSKITDTKINFPSEIRAWKDDINGQWDFGFNFMYKSGNNADGMLLAGRLPMFLILLLLGIYIFKWTRELFGNNTAFLTLFLFSFSPTFIAHGRLVTTDVAASAAIFIALYYFIRWLKNPNFRNLLIAGTIFGLALSAKFSVFLLIPLFGFLIIIYPIIKTLSQNPRTASPVPEETRYRANEQDNIEIGRSDARKGVITALRLSFQNIGGFILLGLISLLAIYIIYIPHVWNYPQERQISDMRFILNSYGGGPDSSPLSSCANIARLSRCPAEITIWMAQKPMLRPLAQYFYGLLMVVQRAAGGNTTYFLGEVSNSGWTSYFPIVYAIKEPLSMHILTIIALLFAAYSINPIWRNPFNRLFGWVKGHIAEFAMICFIILYWVSSIRSPLNIGVRHVLPTFPFIYILTANQIIKWLKIIAPGDTQGFLQKMKFIGKAVIAYSEQDARYIGRTARYSAKYGLVFLLLAWQIISVISIYPNFLTYFNELTNGPKNGYIYVTDSNLDWGQDFKRLTKWVNENNIKEIYVDYFGGTTGEYYLDGKLKPWSGGKDPSALPPDSYLAVSATFRQGCFGTPVPGFNYPACYQWLKNYEPITVIGNSIFVYYIP